MNKSSKNLSPSKTSPIYLNIPIRQDDQPCGDDEPCCGGASAPAASLDQRAGYTICSFVDEFVQTAVGSVPKVKTELSVKDYLGVLRARLGMRRDHYLVAPGLYAVGAPTANSHILATANYKLTFDRLRKNLAGMDFWLLVLDTRGVNVWCAAGKKTFSTQELVQRIARCRLEKLVDHKKIILPQLAAPGVCARQVKEESGFEVIWGPIRAEELKQFFDDGLNAPIAMRQVLFPLKERLVLVPVEVAMFIKPSGWIVAAVLVISGFGMDFFNLSRVFTRGGEALTAYLCGVFSGAFAVPLLLPYLPGRRFFVKGIETGAAGGLLVLFLLSGRISRVESAALFLLCVVTSSWLAMNFTGATPFTSPSGVEKEMRQGMPIQAVMAVGALILWILAPFL